MVLEAKVMYAVPLTRSQFQSIFGPDPDRWMEVTEADIPCLAKHQAEMIVVDFEYQTTACEHRYELLLGFECARLEAHYSGVMPLQSQPSHECQEQMYRFLWDLRQERGVKGDMDFSQVELKPTYLVYVSRP